MQQVSAQLLDAVQGRPAGEVPVRLERAVGPGWRTVGHDCTDASGWVRGIGGPAVEPGAYRLVVESGRYYASFGLVHAQPEAVVAFTVTDRDAVLLPILLAPFGLATYTGVR
jgi:5-hydroxyisourate hydrolase